MPTSVDESESKANLIQLKQTTPEQNEALIQKLLSVGIAASLLKQAVETQCLDLQMLWDNVNTLISAHGSRCIPRFEYLWQLLILSENHPMLFDTTQKDNLGVGPLHYAAWSGNLEAFRVLMNHPEYSSQLNITDATHQNIAFYAMRSKSSSILSELMSDPKYDTLLSGHALGRNIIQEAIRCGNIKAFKLLMESPKYRPLFDAKNEMRYSSVDHAAISGDPEMLNSVLLFMQGSLRFIFKDKININSAAATLDKALDTNFWLTDMDGSKDIHPDIKASIQQKLLRNREILKEIIETARTGSSEDMLDIIQKYDAITLSRAVLDHSVDDVPYQIARRFTDGIAWQALMQKLDTKTRHQVMLASKLGNNSSFMAMACYHSSDSFRATIASIDSQTLNQAALERTKNNEHALLVAAIKQKDDDFKLLVKKLDEKTLNQQIALDVGPCTYSTLYSSAERHSPEVFLTLISKLSIETLVGSTKLAINVNTQKSQHATQNKILLLLAQIHAVVTLQEGNEADAEKLMFHWAATVRKLQTNTFRTVSSTSNTTYNTLVNELANTCQTALQPVKEQALSSYEVYQKNQFQTLTSSSLSEPIQKDLNQHIVQLKAKLRTIKSYSGIRLWFHMRELVLKQEELALAEHTRNLLNTIPTQDATRIQTALTPVQNAQKKSLKPFGIMTIVNQAQQLTSKVQLSFREMQLKADPKAPRISALTTCSTEKATPVAIQTKKPAATSEVQSLLKGLRAQRLLLTEEIQQCQSRNGFLKFVYYNSEIELKTAKLTIIELAETLAQQIQSNNTLQVQQAARAFEKALAENTQWRQGTLRNNTSQLVSETKTVVQKYLKEAQIQTSAKTILATLAPKETVSQIRSSTVEDIQNTQRVLLARAQYPNDVVRVDFTKSMTQQMHEWAAIIRDKNAKADAELQSIHIPTKPLFEQPIIELPEENLKSRISS